MKREKQTGTYRKLKIECKTEIVFHEIALVLALHKIALLTEVPFSEIAEKIMDRAKTEVEKLGENVITLHICELESLMNGEFGDYEDLNIIDKYHLAASTYLDLEVVKDDV